MTLTELCIKRPTFVVVVFSALAVLGVFSYFQLNYELLPKISPPYIVVTTVYPGASPQVVETSVTRVIEDAVSGIDKVKNIFSDSYEGASIVSIEFTNDANVEAALQDSQRKVLEVQGLLPQGIRTPVLSKFALDELPVMRVGAAADLPGKDLFLLLKDQIRPRLSKIAGVAQISLIGGDEREIKINIDRQKLRSYGLSILQTAQAIQLANLDFPTGKIKDKEGQFVVRIAGKIGSLEELRNLVIAKFESGGDIRLREVAEIVDGVKESAHITRVNGRSSIGLIIHKQNDANNVQVCRAVRAELAVVEKDYARDNMKFEIAQDSSLFTMDAVNGVKKDLLIAILLVAGVMLLFLHSFRNSLIVLIAVPASLLSTLIGMLVFGFTLNLMTLLAMSLVIGILVDDSIVVLENIHRFLEKGENRRSAALRGRNDIGITALSITLVDVVVFLPLSLISGLIGNIVREYSLVVVVSTLMSLFVSFTLTPMLASRFTRLEHLAKGTPMGRFGLLFETQYKKMTDIYVKALAWSLRNRGRVVLITGLLLAASISLVPLGFIGAEFMKKSDRGEFSVFLEMPPGTTIAKTNLMARDAETMIAAIPEVKKIFVDVGSSSEGLIGQSADNSAEISVSLIPKNKRRRSQEDIGQEIRGKILTIPGAEVRVNPIGYFGTADDSPINLIISGGNREDVLKAAEIVAGVVRKIPGTVDVRLSSSEGNPETRVEIDRDKMAALGLTIAEVGATMSVALSGDDASKFKDGANEFDIRVMLDEFDRSKTSDVSRLTFVNSRGEQIELKQFAGVTQGIGPTKLQRKNRNYSILVLAQVVNRASGSVSREIDLSLAKETIPAGVSIAYSGDVEMQSDSFKSLSIALLAAILFVYMIMVALYNSYFHPFVVLFSIPLAVVGALVALAMTGNSLNIFSFMAMIMLVGLVAKNAIILVDFTNRQVQDGLSIIEALLAAGRIRLRPILMTTLTMIFGMLPIALAAGSAAEVKSGFAWVLIGGLTSSLLLTLILVPVVYATFENWRRKISALAKAEAGQKEIIP